MDIDVDSNDGYKISNGMNTPADPSDVPDNASDVEEQRVLLAAIDSFR